MKPFDMRGAAVFDGARGSRWSLLLEEGSTCFMLMLESEARRV